MQTKTEQSPLEIINFENMESAQNNESNLTAEEEADIADNVTAFDTGYDD